MNDIKKNPLLFKALSQHKFNQKLKKSIYKNVNKKGKRKKIDIESVPFSGQVISLNNEVIQKLDINLENFLTMKVVGNKSTLVGIQLNYKENAEDWFGVFPVTDIEFISQNNQYLFSFQNKRLPQFHQAVP